MPFTSVIILFTKYPVTDSKWHIFNNWNMIIRRIIVLCFVTLFTCQISAITDNELANIAMSKLGKGTFNIKKHNAYSIIQPMKGQGYVVVDLRDKHHERIIAYSTEGYWKDDQMPPIILSWLNNIAKNTINSSSVSQTNGNDWADVHPLLSCHWHQNSPYNDMSPVIEDGNVKTAAGCVAIAAAQIAYYWRRDNPIYTLKDTPTYIYGGAPVSISIPKGSPNKWELMLDQYSVDDTQESRDAVAQLCYVVGTTSYLNYASSTGGSIRDAANAMYSQFNLLSEYISKSKTTYSDWVELLYNDINKGYPVMCSGVGNGGHAFVLDGYDSETGLFHFNFGWGGSGDGYYPVDDSEDSMGGYFMGQAIVYDIHPSSMNIEASLNCTYNSHNAYTINVVSTIKNNSTLPIKHLSIYAVSDDSTLEETESAIWQGPEIDNDGIEHSISATFNIVGDRNIVLYLTDERKYELAHYALNIENSIGNINYDQRTFQSYNLFGQKVNDCQKGIYIIDFGTHKKKIVIYD